jgi:hypothetical protein
MLLDLRVPRDHLLRPEVSGLQRDVAAVLAQNEQRGRPMVDSWFDAMAEPEAVEDVDAIVQPATSVLLLAQEGVFRQVAQAVLR